MRVIGTGWHGAPRLSSWGSNTGPEQLPVTHSGGTSERGSVRIGLRPASLWSTLVVSSHRPGLFVPKPSHRVCGLCLCVPDVQRIVHQRPLASVAGDGRSYSLRYSARVRALAMSNSAAASPRVRCRA
jgi:hypothetical protein